MSPGGPGLVPRALQGGAGGAVAQVNTDWPQAGLQRGPSRHQVKKWPPGADGKVQQAGSRWTRRGRGLPASLTPTPKLSSRARACPQPSANREGPLSTGGSVLAVGKDEVFPEFQETTKGCSLCHRGQSPESPGLQRDDQARLSLLGGSAAS